MANNKLILRTVISPWVTPFNDITTNSVLSRADVDNNFIYLKGEIIHSGYTNNNQLILQKINGQNIVIDNIGGSSTDVFVTGGTYLDGVATFTNNTGGTFNISGFFTGGTDVFVTGGTYDNTTGTATFTDSSGNTFNVTGFLTGYTNYYTTGATLNDAILSFDRTDALSAYTVDLSSLITYGNQWFIPSGTTVEIKENHQSFIYGDLYIEGLLLLNDNSQLVVLNGDLILSGGSISGNGTTLLVDLPLVDTYITGGTYSGGSLTLTNNIGNNVVVSGFSGEVSGEYLPLSGGTMYDDAIIRFDNYSELKEGSFDFGGNGGISQICAVGYENNWQAGVNYIFDYAGLIREARHCFDIIPNNNFDSNSRFKVGSRWVLDNGDVYICSDDTVGSAVWYLEDKTFTGNTSGDCISDLYISNLYGCSPITIHNSIQSNGSSANSGLGIAFGENAMSNASQLVNTQIPVSIFQECSVLLEDPLLGSVIVLSGDVQELWYTYVGNCTDFLLSGSTGTEIFNGCAIIDVVYDSGFTYLQYPALSGSNYTIISGDTFNYINVLTYFPSFSFGKETLSSGLFSFSEGINSTASGQGSHAEGFQTTASGAGSHAEGGFDVAGSFSGGKATGLASHAEGVMTTASGAYSHAEGFNSIASGLGSHAEGGDTVGGNWPGGRAVGASSHAEGISTTASGRPSHAEGSSTTASGIGSHAEGQLTIASGAQSHAEGSSTTASGLSSHAEGELTTASGNYSHTEGRLTIASGAQSHAEGLSTTASGDYSHTEGYYSTAQGYSSHAEGGNILLGPVNGKGGYALGIGSHAEGLLTTSIGNYSHAGGNNSISSGVTSFIHSTNSIVLGDRSVVLGGQSITGSTNDTVYVPDFVIKKSASAPTTSGDTVGEIGSITWDNTNLYIKTSTGWGKIPLDYSW